MVSRWAPLQVSAHILQNLLLWWNLSATLRGCASFFLESLGIAPSRWQFGKRPSHRLLRCKIQGETAAADPANRPLIKLRRCVFSWPFTNPLRCARQDDESAILARRARTDLPGESGRDIAQRDKGGETKQSAQTLSRGLASEFTQTAILTAVKASRRDRG